MRPIDVSDYHVIFQAKWAGISVTEYLNLPLYWSDRIAVAMAAEHQAREEEQAEGTAGRAGTPRPNPGHKPAGVVQGLPRLGA